MAHREHLRAQGVVAAVLWISDWPAWRAKAACLGEDTEEFFPQGTTGDALAKAVCAGCKVRAECLDYAMTTNQHDGVWGGTSEDDRRSERRRQDRATPRDER